jgi:hypothetical protein
MLRSVLFGGLVVWAALVTPAFSKSENLPVDRLVSALMKSGFENIAVVLEDQHLIVTYENRRYRDELAAAEEVISHIFALFPEEIEVTLIPQNRKIPLIAMTLAVNQSGAGPANGKSARAGDWSGMHVDLEFDAAWKKLQTLAPVIASTWKIDLVVHPQFHALFGNYGNPVRSQINIAPALNTSLWKGMSLCAQLIIPLQNELEKEGDHVRPGLLTINQTLRLPRNVFASASVGYFTKNRYGLDVETQKYFFNGKASVGANFGYTGYASYLQSVWRYSTIDRLTMLLNAEFRFPQVDLSLRATYGKFLYQDVGWRVNLMRQFREVDFGFFLMRSASEMNTGFHFSVPLFPRKHLGTRALRIKTADYFPWEYRYKGIPDNGELYDTGNHLEGFMKRLNPSYVRNQIHYYQRWRNFEFFR